MLIDATWAHGTDKNKKKRLLTKNIFKENLNVIVKNLATCVDHLTDF